MYRLLISGIEIVFKYLSLDIGAKRIMGLKCDEHFVAQPESPRLSANLFAIFAERLPKVFPQQGLIPSSVHKCLCTKGRRKALRIEEERVHHGKTVYFCGVLKLVDGDK